MNKLRVGDEVQVIAGRDKGKRGKILKILVQASGNRKVLVEGVNLIKKHVKPNPQANIQGGIVEKEAALEVSNVALFDQASGKAAKVGIKFTEEGKKVRYFKSTNQVIEQA